MATINLFLKKSDKSAIKKSDKKSDKSAVTYVKDAVIDTAINVVPGLIGQGIKEAVDRYQTLSDQIDETAVTLAAETEELIQVIEDKKEQLSFSNRVSRLKSASEAGRNKAVLANTIASSSYSAISLFDGTPGQLRMKLAANADFSTSLFALKQTPSE